MTSHERSEPRAPRLLRPLQQFLHTEAAGGIVLLVAAVFALTWANVAAGSYDRVWHTTLTVGVGDWTITEDLRHWINDGAMTLFFFVVGLEIKRELVSGELRDHRAATLPAIAAVGGMVVPALIFYGITAGTAGSRGWGIPMATDIAFAVGVLAVAGRGLPSGLRLFLLTLAIVDDIGAIVVIALFYSDSIAFDALAAASGLLALMSLLRRAHVRPEALYLLLGAGVWLTVFESGVHATIAGVALAFVTPAVAFRQARAHKAVSPLARLEQGLHPWTSFLIVPLFALANAGVRLGGRSLNQTASLRVTAAVAAGLVIGKIAGITLGALVATRLGLARLPTGVVWSHVVGVAAIGGIGFTVSLFIASLAFTDSAPLDAAKLGILAGSVLSGVAGSVVLMRARRARRR